MMLKVYFENVVKEALNSALECGAFLYDGKIDVNFICDTPKNAEFGDFAVNVSLLSKFFKMPPVKIAEILDKYIKKEDFETTIVNGFINFKLSENFLKSILEEILQKKGDFGKIDLGKGKKVNIEYVSANPTGPFHIGHGRWAAIGSSLSEILKYAGFDVFQEFYINDAGGQINKLAKSLELRVRELKGEKVQFDDDLYKGEYLIPCAKEFLKDNKGLNYGDFAKQYMLNIQKELLKKFRVNFDLFFSELSLYKNNEVEKCVCELKNKNKLYEKDGAIWFKSTDYTDTQDRVLKKSDGTNTYLTADIAYHKNKFTRGFDLLINIWGADHHGYIPRMKAAMDALGFDSSKLEILLGQLVNIIENGEAVRMGKRKKMVTLGELVDEVGVDSTRYWMLMRSIDTTLDFDVELAKTKSDQNPVFYVQYAHARCSSILRRATETRLDIDSKTEIEPYMTKEDLENILNSSSVGQIYSSDIDSDTSIKKLILKLEEFKSVIEAAVRLKAPYLLCKFAQELAFALHHFYNYTRVLTDDRNLTISRLKIVYSVKLILAKTLELLKVDAPEKM